MTFYLPLLLTLVFGYAASGACEVLDRLGESETMFRKIVGFLSVLGLIGWGLLVCSFFLAAKWWHPFILLFASIIGVKIYDFLIAIVATFGDKAMRIWLCISSFAVLPLLVWTGIEMYKHAFS